MSVEKSRVVLQRQHKSGDWKDWDWINPKEGTEANQINYLKRWIHMMREDGNKYRVVIIRTVFEVV